MVFGGGWRWLEVVAGGCWWLVVVDSVVGGWLVAVW